MTTRRYSARTLSYFRSINLLFAFVLTAFCSQQVVAQNATITVGNVQVRPNETFKVPVTISDVTGLGVTAFDIALTYDADLITITQASLENPLSGSSGANMTLAINTDTPGRIAMAAAGVTPISGTGNIIILTAQSLATGGTTSIAFEQVALNEGNPASTGIAGSVEVDDTLFGDATLNGEVTAQDAAEVLRHASGVITLTGQAFESGEVSGNGELTAYDAAFILQKVAGIIPCFNVDPSCSAGKTQTAPSVTAGWGKAYTADASILVPFVLEDVKGSVYALTINIDGIDETLTSKDLGLTLPEGWGFQYNETVDGTHRIVLAGVNALDSDTLFTLNLPNQPTSLQANIQVHEAAMQSLNTFDYAETPDTYTLDANYPNPFNPTTTIQYALPAEGQVRLAVYDMLGREVARLVDSNQKAGTHRVSFDAQDLSSGVYIYRIEANGFTQTRQMTLVK